MSDDKLREEPIDGSIVYEGLFLKIQRDRARMPDGGEAGREFVLHPGASAMVPIFPDERILIERQFRYPLKRVFTEIPAGKIDTGETPLQTAQRELIEETGYAAAEWAPLTSIHPAIGFADERIDIFLCRDMHERRQSLDASEFVEIDFVTVGWLVDELRAGRLTDVKTQIATHWLDNLFAGRWEWPTFERV
ncbi:MAG: NUDIX domain-containing protein [Burkholderiaceae bacterium]